MSRIFLLLALLPVALAPVALAQTASGTPDLSQVALDPSSVTGWTPNMAVRDEVWDVPQSAAAPDAPSELAWYETRFTRDGGHEVLTTRATEARSDLADAYLQGLRHNALGQTPIQVGSVDSSRFGWRERDTATAVARPGSLTVELRLSGLLDADPVGDDQITTWLSDLLQRASDAPMGPVFDWTQALPNQPQPWMFVLDAGLVGSDWQQQTGLELSAREQDGQAASVIAAREFNRTGAFRRTLDSSATVFASDDAATQAMTGPGTAIDAPALGDDATAFRAAEGGVGHETPSVSYTVNVRRGDLVMTTQETGVAWSLDSPGEAFALASAIDARASQLLSQ
ncbi:MAG: hypothetical protein JOZ65_04325 [Chloroflexi bacterium]|nr:hypothetical protein [Chloroflexota bacterium]